MSFQRTWAACRKTKAETGFRSKLEVALAQALDTAKVPYQYESARIYYPSPAFYIPDFILTEQCIIIEAKGAFDSADRTKMLQVKAQHPDLDIRFLFSNPGTRISKQSTTTYGAWCVKNRFPFAKQGGHLPPEWLSHKPGLKQQEALKRILTPHGS